MKQVLVLFLLSLFLNASTTVEQLQHYFAPEEKMQQSTQLDFDIVSASSTQNFIGGFEDGTYTMQHYVITEVAKNIYKLAMKLSKKQGMLSFDQNVEFIFWYNMKSSIVFKTKEGKRRFLVDPKVSEYLQKINPLQSRLIRKYETKTFKLPYMNGEVVINVRFKKKNG